ncbi:MAG: class I SAM-dependent methyltransferase [Pseudomonadota bacterium]|nr:class I SAM-dependent methyltransferase [Pseudomonadota bacterium]
MFEKETTATPLIPERIVDLLRAPNQLESSDLVLESNALVCSENNRRFEHVSGVPSLLQFDDIADPRVTQKVKDFYEEYPFPNYEGIEEFGDLVSKGRQNLFSTQLLSSIGYNKTVLECGCGTGQLSHFLQLNHNHVLGVDMSLNSLKLAIEHKLRNGLERSGFVQMNIFDLAIKDNSFDIAISHGVLHHTPDPSRAFSEIVRKVKPGGVVMVGLYNKYGRVPTWLRSKLIGTLGPNLDYVVRSRIHDKTKADIWIKDQYYNPHESWHSLDEVLGWFEENNVEFLNTSPAILGTDGEFCENLFKKTKCGNFYQRLVTQLSWIFTISREGALFDIIGRKCG